MAPARPSPFSAAEPIAEDAPPRCFIAADPDAIDLHHRIRHEVFVREQRIFTDSDRDERDDEASTLKVLGVCGSDAAGAVRLYVLDHDRGVWQGDRLAVLHPFRRHGMGAPLVRFAVATAAERGGTVMVAHIQPPNVAWFEHLGWSRAGEPEIYVGLPHQPMQIRLDSPTPIASALGLRK
jgi:putative N-acetyltransferase (TIGR04045 family)